MTIPGHGGQRDWRRALECLLGLPATEGNRIEVLHTGDEAIGSMLQAVQAGTRTVDLQTFRYFDGDVGAEVAAALGHRARAGVRVRVLLDGFGTSRIARGLLDRLRGDGVDVRWFRPLSNWRVTQSTHRSHRRILVCDGEVAFTGGVGIADEWRGGSTPAWCDLQVRVEGPAVSGLAAAFVDNWAETGRVLFDEDVDRLPEHGRPGTSVAFVVSGDAETGWGNLATLARALIGFARERVRIAADYFVPDEGILDLLAGATRRGVEVDLLRPGGHVPSRASHLSSQAQYGRVLAAGVRVWEYRPTVLNARTITVDGRVASIGGINFNWRSLTHDDEVNLVVVDPDVVAEVDARFEADLRQAERVREGPPPASGQLERAARSTLGFLARHL